MIPIKFAHKNLRKNNFQAGKVIGVIIATIASAECQPQEELGNFSSDQERTIDP